MSFCPNAHSMVHCALTLDNNIVKEGMCFVILHNYRECGQGWPYSDLIYDDAVDLLSDICVCVCVLCVWRSVQVCVCVCV